MHEFHRNRRPASAPGASGSTDDCGGVGRGPAPPPAEAVEQQAADGPKGRGLARQSKQVVAGA